jgi:hypothetical protein
MLSPKHYSARASELEAAAKRVSDPKIRASMLDLARSFRDIANLVSVAGDSKADDLVQLASAWWRKSL